MYVPCRIVVSHYKPLRIEKGMLFADKIDVGDEIRWKIWELKHNFPNDDEDFISRHGFPVEIHLIDLDDLDNNIIASQHEFGWIDDDNEYLREMTLHDINIIFQQYNGECFIDCSQDKYMEENMIVPIYVEEKVVIRFEDDEDFFFDDDDNYDEADLEAINE